LNAFFTFLWSAFSIATIWLFGLDPRPVLELRLELLRVAMEALLSVNAVRHASRVANSAKVMPRAA
jgi:hypothetical protein